MASTGTHTTIELLEAVFSVQSFTCYIRTITASVQWGKKNSGRESKGSCRQDELIGNSHSDAKIKSHLTFAVSPCSHYGL
jgi:hypothetical protein